ncbi:MAG: glycosyltransferase [Candidatus Abawacabacteria bacterium]|nr:glycosyltransferase [Candidatus Abawacabacteria bacterium]
MKSLIAFGGTFMAVSLFLAGHALYNLFFCLKPSKKHAKPNANHGLVTVMIPARNEEKVIEKCLRSIMKQDYPQWEAIIYNDQSSDQTGAIADSLAKEDPRICVMHGKHLPEGWVGKNHGCYQMSQKAKGHWYLFGDSDTVYEPDAISRALATADEHGLEFLSFFPRFDNYTFGERALLPLFYFYVCSFVPLTQITTNPHPHVVAVNGSFILVKQSLYEQIGGHVAVKDKILEDVLMGRHTKSLGHKVGYGDGTSLYSVHMYDNVRGIWEGFSKNAFSFFGWNYLHATLFILFIFIFCFFPFVAIVLGWLNHNLIFLLTGLISGAVYLFTMLVLSFQMRQGLWGVIMFPISIFLSLAVIVNSMIRVATGKGLTWKGRSYAR